MSRPPGDNSSNYWSGADLPQAGLTLHTRTIVVSLVLGTLVTVIASLRPALRATRVPPIAAVREGASEPAEIVARVYTDVHPKAHAMAERAVIAHLEKLEADNLIAKDGGGCYIANVPNP